MNLFVRSTVALAVCGLVACGGSSGDTTVAADGADEEISKGISCDAQLAAQDKWDDMLLNSKGKEVDRSALPPAAATYSDHVQGSDLVLYKADFGSTFAVTFAPNNTDTILGKVVVFFSSGARVATGTWGDSPQINWQGSCHRR
jgi:hypothetical protein